MSYINISSYKTTDYPIKKKLAIFDLDYTLIKPKSNKIIAMKTILKNNDIIKELDIKIEVYSAIYTDFYRKPGVGINLSSHSVTKPTVL